MWLMLCVVCGEGVVGYHPEMYSKLNFLVIKFQDIHLNL